MDRELISDPSPIPSVRSFDIAGLYGIRDYSVSIVDNRLILVGENGTGKSTVVTMLYQFLSRQWEQLARSQFDSISLKIGHDYLSLDHEDIENYLEEQRDRARHYPNRMREIVLEEMRQLDLFSSTSEIHVHNAARHIAARYGMSARAARNLVLEFTEAADPDSSPVARVSQRLGEIFDVSVLFLPTYRRIERDLAEIFPLLDPERNELRNERRRTITRTGRHSSAYVELVEFGMEDVEQLIHESMAGLREALRRALDALTGEYLRDVLKKEYQNVDTAPLRELEAGTLDSILDRIDESILPAADKQQLPQTISRIIGSDDVAEDDRVVAHFMSKIIQLHSEQGEREAPVRNFARVCNRYLQDKQFDFDNSGYALVVRAGGAQLDQQDATGSELKLSALSSGEKQIVSLFAHLFLASEKRFLVVIDEPELSLSVPWQRSFLPDIANSGHCAGLIAVTHSPFIYENELENYTHSISEFSQASR